MPVTGFCSNVAMYNEIAFLIFGVADHALDELTWYQNTNSGSCTALLTTHWMVTVLPLRAYLSWCPEILELGPEDDLAC